MMAYKWSNMKRFNKLYQSFKNSGDVGEKVVRHFEDLKQKGKLPQQLDPEHKVIRFVGDNYADQRFTL